MKDISGNNRLTSKERLKTMLSAMEKLEKSIDKASEILYPLGKSYDSSKMETWKAGQRVSEQAQY
jgi:hypothetical protein